MNILTKRAIDKKTYDIYKYLYTKLKRGMFLSLMMNIFKASGSSRQMDVSSLKLSDQFDKDNKLQNKVKCTMFYPMILIVVTIIVVNAVFTMILSNFFDVFGNMGFPIIT